MKDELTFNEDQQNRIKQIFLNDLLENAKRFINKNNRLSNKFITKALELDPNNAVAQDLLKQCNDKLKDKISKPLQIKIHSESLSDRIKSHLEAIKPPILVCADTIKGEISGYSKRYSEKVGIQSLPDVVRGKTKKKPSMPIIKIIHEDIEATVELLKEQKRIIITIPIAFKKKVKATYLCEPNIIIEGISNQYGRIILKDIPPSRGVISLQFMKK